jgi:hypothetical protein
MSFKCRLKKEYKLKVRDLKVVVQRDWKRNSHFQDFLPKWGLRQIRIHGQSESACNNKCRQAVPGSHDIYTAIDSRACHTKHLDNGKVSERLETLGGSWNLYEIFFYKDKLLSLLLSIFLTEIHIIPEPEASCNHRHIRSTKRAWGWGMDWVQFANKTAEWTWLV